ncbi:MAG: hypothetical protein WC516_08600 [Patescibacteria group bacterium]|jgi:hypothetical protein
MNQEQRKFLVEQVQKTYKEQVDELRKQIPERPSLNNYLVAAFLDNSIQFNDIEALKSKMRDTVLKFGISDRLVKEKSSWARESAEKDTDAVWVDANDLFIIPQNYKDALNEYEKQKTIIGKQIDNLESTKRTIIMKIQIGSTNALDKLVMQVDSIGDLNLLNTQLMINASQDKG